MCILMATEAMEDPNFVYSDVSVESLDKFICMGDYTEKNKFMSYLNNEMKLQETTALFEQAGFELSFELNISHDYAYEWDYLGLIISIKSPQKNIGCMTDALYLFDYFSKSDFILKQDTPPTVDTFPKHTPQSLCFISNITTSDGMSWHGNVNDHKKKIINSIKLFRNKNDFNECFFQLMKLAML